MIDIIFKLGILLLFSLIGLSPLIFMWIRDLHEENKQRKEFKQIETINESIATRNDAIVTLNETILSGELKQFAGALIKQRNI